MAYRTAARRVLEVEGDPDSVDLSNVDVNDLLQRFRIKNKAKLAEPSFAAYESRFRRGLDMYMRWLDDDPDWAGKPRRSRKRGVKTAPNSESGTPMPTASTPPVSAPADEHGRDGGALRGKSELSDYPVALVDSKVTAILRLPQTYTTGDAARMSALINALAVPSNAGWSSIGLLLIIFRQHVRMLAMKLVFKVFGVPQKKQIKWALKEAKRNDKLTLARRFWNRASNGRQSQLHR